MRLLLNITVSILFALFTGWLTMVIIANFFCSGYQQNWLCSDHGGGLVGTALLVIIISLPAYITIFKKVLNNGKQVT